MNNQASYLTLGSSHGLMRTKFDPSLRSRDLERSDPKKLGNPPALPMIPERNPKPSEEEEGEEKREVKIEVSDGVTKRFFEFAGGTNEELIKLVKRHEALLEDMELEDQYKANVTTIKEKEAEISQLRLSGRTHSNDMRDAKEALKELVASQEELKRLAYSYMEKLLSEELCVVWNEVVTAQCDTAPYYDLNGRQQNSKRGRTFDALQACYKHFLARFMPIDSSERQTRYIDTIVRKGKAAIVPLAYRADELNCLQQYLPCLRMTPNCPAGVPRGDKPKSELEMCMRLMGMLPVSLSAAYYASKGADHFPVDFQKLVADLVLVEKNEDRQKALFKQLHKAESSKQDEDGSEKPAKKKMKKGDRIPKKGKFGNGDAKAAAKADAVERRTQKLCNRCAQWAPAIKNTHNTAQCQKFNADGTRKDGRPNKTVNVHGHDDELLSAFHTMRKEQKQLRKQIKKMSLKKKGKKKRGYASSDDESSSSDSD